MKIISNRIVITVISWLCFASTYGQTDQKVSVDLPKTAAELGLDEQVYAEIVSNINEALNEYVRLGTLYDLNSNEINEESIDSFLNLFKDKDSPEIFKDYIEPLPSEDLISAREYTYEISEYFFESGFQFDISEAVLIDIDATSDFYYSVKVEVTKNLFNYLNGSTFRMEKFFGEGLGRKLLFEYDLDKENIDDISLYRIDYNGVFETIADPVSVIGVYGLGGTSLLSAQTSEYWNDTHSSSSIDSRGGFSFGFGVDFMSTALINKKDKANKKLGFIVGAKFLSEEYITELNNFELTPFDIEVSKNGESTIYQREVTSVSTEEKVRVNSIGVSFGMNYIFTDIKKERKKLFSIALKATPTFSVGAPSFSSIGKGDYNGRLYIKEPSSVDAGDGDLSDFSLLGENAITSTGLLTNTLAWTDFEAGEDQSIDVSELEDLEINSTGLRLEISPTYHLNFKDEDPGWGIVIGLDIGYMLTSPFKHDELNLDGDNQDASSFRFNDQVTESLINQYYSGLNNLSIMFRIGLMNRYTPLSYTY